MRARLLLVVPATVGLVFAGVAPAVAHPGNGGDDDASARILKIADEAEVSGDGNSVEVAFKYKCEDGDDNDEEVVANVLLRQRNGDARYAEEGVSLRCNDTKRWKMVELDRVSDADDEVDDGDKAVVWVVLRTEDDGRLDRERQKVEIED
jgi:hypothetical protein